MITYVKGDATKPIGSGTKIITHVCNNIGVFGAGFVIALSKRWPQPEKEFHSLRPDQRKLGTIQCVGVTEDITVVNMIAQEGIYPDKNGKVPIRYESVRECLKTVNKIALESNATIHAPRFGSGLAGGKWEEIEKIILETIDVDVTIYDLK